MSSSQPIICVPKQIPPSFSQNSPSLPQNSVSSLFRNSTLETVFRPFPSHAPTFVVHHVGLCACADRPAPKLVQSQRSCGSPRSRNCHSLLECSDSVCFGECRSFPDLCLSPKMAKHKSMEVEHLEVAHVDGTSSVDHEEMRRQFCFCSWFLGCVSLSLSLSFFVADARAGIIPVKMTTHIYIAMIYSFFVHS